MCVHGCPEVYVFLGDEADLPRLVRANLGTAGLVRLVQLEQLVQLVPKQGTYGTVRDDYGGTVVLRVSSCSSTAVLRIAQVARLKWCVFELALQTASQVPMYLYA